MTRTLIAALLLSAAVAGADPLLTLDPASISGPPGFATGWGFTLQGDSTYYTEIVGTFTLNETNPLLGSFTDYISAQGGPVNGYLAPGGTWSQSYNSALQTGFGEYALLPTDGPGDSDSGQFVIQYQLFSGDPTVCGSCFVSSGILINDFSVTATPEPDSFGTIALAGLLCLVLRRRRGMTAPHHR